MLRLACQRGCQFSQALLDSLHLRLNACYAVANVANILPNQFGNCLIDQLALAHSLTLRQFLGQTGNSDKIVR